MDFLNILIISASFTFIYFAFLWGLSNLIKKNSVLDIGWGIGIVFIALITLVYNGSFFYIQVIVTALTVLWGLRLSFYVLIRDLRIKSDFRYKELEKKWGNSYWIKSFSIFMTAAILMMIVSSSLQFINSQTVDRDLDLFFYIGVMVWFAGFIFECVADFQLFRFKLNNKDKIMNSGVWKYSRHPNYFGEILIWTGIFIVALGYTNGFLTIISPLVITYSLLMISGIRLMEKSLRQEEAYKKYMQSTSTLVPGFPVK